MKGNKQREPERIVMKDNPKEVIMIDKDEIPHSGNVTKLAEIIPDYFCPDSEVAVYNIVSYEDGLGDNYINAQLANLSDKTIKGVYFRVTGYSKSGGKLGTQEYSIIDLAFEPCTTMPTGFIKLFHTDIERVRLDITRVIDMDYNSRDVKIGRLVPMPKLAKVGDKLDNIVVEILGLAEDEKYFVDPLQDGFYICTCGHLRKNKCPVCGRTDGLDNDMNEVSDRIKATISDIVGNVNEIDDIGVAYDTRNRLDRHLMTIATMRGFDSVKEYGKEGLKKLDKRIKKLERKAKRGKKPMIIAVIIILLIAVIGMIIYMNGGIDWVKSLLS